MYPQIICIGSKQRVAFLRAQSLDLLQSHLHFAEKHFKEENAARAQIVAPVLVTCHYC